MDAILRQSLEALGLPLIVAEPEVVQRDLARIYCKTLAGIIVKLINENEPMLRASNDGSTVTVREIGDDQVMKFTIDGAGR